MVDRSTILNAFRPNSEIENPAAFAGRTREVRNLTDALLTDRSCPVIYGERGLGKTSLAVQMARIALGDSALLEQVGASGSILSADEVFVPFIVSCSDATRNKDEILQRLINTAEGYKTLAGLEGREADSATSRKKLNLKVFELESTKNFSAAEKRKHSRLNVEDRLLAVIDAIQASGIHKFLFVIDELDRAANTDGLANFIKNASSDSVKFLLVGIANNISTLVSGHESIERNLQPVRVRTMNRAELAEIVERALALLRGNGVEIDVAPDATERLVSAAGGYPWFVHILGQEALRSVWDSKRSTIQATDVDEAIRALAQNRFAQQFSDAYQMAVRDSRTREIVLRLIAKWPENDVPLSEVYPVAKRLGVSNPSVSKKDLMLVRHGSVILAPPEHERGVVRFRNAVFKRSINLRHSIYSGVRGEVDEAWGNRT